MILRLEVSKSGSGMVRASGIRLRAKIEPY